jgi:hypothetical protein
MSWISDIFGQSAKGLLDGLGGIIDQFHLSPEQKEQFKLQMQALLQKRDDRIQETLRSELAAKERVLVAELSQGDNYTKRARPTVVYVGLAVIVFNYCIVPVLLKLGGLIATLGGHTAALDSIGYEPLTLPVEFWLGWSGIVATWSIGRSAEKRGIRNKAVSMITGSKLLPTLLTAGLILTATGWV